MKISIFLITEFLGVKVHVLFEMLVAGQAAVEHLIRFIWALGGRKSAQLSGAISVPRQYAPHVLTSASLSVTANSP